MNEIKNTIIYKICTPETRKPLVLRLYRSLLKSLNEQPLIAKDPFLKTFLKIRISIKFIQFRKLKNFHNIYDNYWNGLNFLNIIKNSNQQQNSEILTKIVYGPRRFFKSLSLIYAKELKIKRVKAQKMLKEELGTQKLGYNFPLPQEMIEFINKNPYEKRFNIIYEPKIE